MNTTLVITLIGDDKPGLVERLSSLCAKHEANWLDSSMAQLAGKFAGVMRVGIPADAVEDFQRELAALSDLRITVEAGSPAAPGGAPTRRLAFSLVGHDRIGIVREVSQVFARHGVNVEKLATYTSPAAMSSEILFHAEAELLAGDGVDSGALKADLERLSNDLIADITLDEQIGG